MSAPDDEARQLSRLLFESRELIDMFGDVVEKQSGKTDTWSRRVRDEIDTFRESRGWSAHGYGNEEST